MKRNVLRWNLIGCLAGVLVSCQPEMKSGVPFNGAVGTVNGPEGLGTAFVFTFTYPQKPTTPGVVKITGPREWSGDGVHEINYDFTREGSGKKLRYYRYGTSGSPQGVFTITTTLEGVDFSLTRLVDASIILPRPTGLHISATTDNVVVNWSQVPGASAYNVCVLERVGVTTYTWGCEITTGTSVQITPFEKLVGGHEYIASVVAWSADLTQDGELNLPAQVNASETDLGFTLP